MRNELTINDTTNICISGGADDADLQWGMCAGKLGHHVIHYSFVGHATAAPKTELVILNDQQLMQADAAVMRANKTLGRTFPSKSIKTNNLLRRNWYQVKDSETLYAISSFKDGRVQGGTAWAVQMFIDRFDGETIPCYVYDQNVEKWFKWFGDRFAEVTVIPQPSGIWAGIGTRYLLPSGKNAIRTLMDYHPV